MKKDNDEERSLPYRCYLLFAIAIAMVGKNHLLQRSIFIMATKKKKKFEKYSIAHPMNCNNGH